MRKAKAAHGPTMVSGVQLAHHFGVVRTRIDQLVAQGVFKREPDGRFDQDVSRLKYFDHLRSEYRRSPASAANAAHAQAKTELLRLRIEEKQRTLVPLETFEATIDAIAGLMLTKLGEWPFRIAGADLALRRKAEALLRELRVEMAKEALARADAEERSLEEQASG